MLPLIIYKFIQTTAERFQKKQTAAALTTQKTQLASNIKTGGLSRPAENGGKAPVNCCKKWQNAHGTVCRTLENQILIPKEHKKYTTMQHLLQVVNF